MPTPDQLQRVVYELALFQATIKYGDPLTDRQRHVLKHKLYEVIFEMECANAPSGQTDQPSGTPTAKPSAA